MWNYNKMSAGRIAGENQIYRLFYLNRDAVTNLCNLWLIAHEIQKQHVAECNHGNVATDCIKKCNILNNKNILNLQQNTKGTFSIFFFCHFVNVPAWCIYWPLFHPSHLFHFSHYFDYFHNWFYTNLTKQFPRSVRKIYLFIFLLNCTSVWLFLKSGPSSS